MTNTCISTTSSGQCPDGFARRKRCVTTSEIPDCVAFDVDVEEEENEERKKPQDDVEDVLWMGNKDGAGIEGGSFEMRTRAKSSPACMRWYVERQVGRHLRRISDDFNTHIPRLTTAGDAHQQSAVTPRQAEVRPDNNPLPVAVGALPPSPFSSSRDGLWSRMAMYFRPARPRMQSGRVSANESNGLSTTEDDLCDSS